MATYYVSTTGDDADPGTLAEPWATMQHAADTAVAGDDVIFLNGTYSAGTGDFFDTNSGSSGNWITFRAQTTGSVILEYNNNAEWKWTFDGVDYVHMIGFVVDCDRANVSAAVRIKSATYIYVQDCTIRETLGHGFRIQTGTINNITIDGCDINPNYWSGTGRDGVYIYGPASYITVTGCTIHRTDHNGVSVNYADNITIDNNEIYAVYSHGVSLSSDASTVTVRDNYIHGDPTWSYGSIRGIENGIFIHDDGQSYIYIYRNDICDCSDAAIYLRDDIDGPVYIWNNSCYNTNQEVGDQDDGTIHAWNITGTTPVVEIKNNIFHTTQYRAMHLESGCNLGNFDMDYNLWNATTNPSGQEIRRLGVTYATFAAYQAAGYEPNSVMQQDPLWLDKANCDFTLRSGSPAIDAGVDVGLPYHGAAPDIGSYEYRAGLSTSTSSSTTTSTSSSTSSTSSTSTSLSTSTSITSTSISLSTTTSVSTSSSTSQTTSTSQSTSTSVTTSTTFSTSTSTSLTSTSTSTTSTSVSTSLTTSSSLSTSYSTSTTQSSTSTSVSTSSSSSTSVSTSTTVSQSTSLSTTTSTLLPLTAMREVCAAEHDVILVPDTDSSDEYAYRQFSVVDLLGINRRMLRAYSGFGLPPLHFITQRGPYQDGETALDMRLDPRTVQVVVAEPLFHRMDFWDRRNEILDLLRPNRSFNGVVRPLVYRKWLPAGKIERGTDLVTTAWSTTVTSAGGRFVERGVQVGDRFDIISGSDQGTTTVATVVNDYTLTLADAPQHTATGVHYRFRRGWAKRDLYCLLEQGPAFDEGPGAAPIGPTGYREALRFVAHDPCWYSDVELSHTWSTAMTAVGDLVFDNAGAWFAEHAGVAGRWLFNISYVGDTTSIYYWGTVRARPTITITGPAENPEIQNTTTGTSIEMDYEIADGEVVTIDTLALTVTNDSGDNLLPYTTGDLATFGLEPPPQAPNRINNVVVSFGGATSSSAVSMTWKNRYIGI